MNTSFKEIASGIDISKSKLDIAIRNFQEIIAYQEFSNDTEGAKLCLELLIKHGCLDVAMESTGPYWYGIYDYLTANGIHTILVNPSMAKTNVTNKSDKIDSASLATLHLLNQLKPSYVPDKDVRRLRRLTRFRASLVDMKTAIKNQTTACINSFSSEITSVYARPFGKSGRKLLSMLTEGDKKKDQDEFMKELDSKLKLTHEKRNKIAEIVNRAYTPSLFDPWFIEVSSKMITEIESWIAQLNDAIAKAVDSNPKIREYVDRLLTIKGVGLDTAQQMAVEIADIDRFESSGSLVRYAGINPKIIQSGSVKKYGSLEKRGPASFRRALYQAAHSMTFEGPDNFQRHFEAVKGRYGKKLGPIVGTVSTSRKLVRLIWSMLTNKTDFIDSPQKLTETKKKKMLKRVKRFDSSNALNNGNDVYRPPMIKLLLNLDKLNPEVKGQVQEMLAQL